MPVVLLIILVALIVALYCSGLYFYNRTISTVSGKQPLGNPEKKKTDDHDSERNKSGRAGWDNSPVFDDGISFSKDHSYFDEHKTEELYMQSRDGLMLHGTAVVNNASRWVILCHGYISRAKQMSVFAELFAGLDFSVLAIDLRGHGESEGSYRGMGWHDSFDIWDWASLIEKRYKTQDIVLFGLSMGGAAVMMASGHALPDSVKGIIEDCGYSSVKAELKYNMRIRYHLPSFPVLNMLSLVTKRRAGYSLLTDGDAIAQLKLTRLPMLFIHGEADRFVPFSMFRKAYKAAGGPKMKFTVPGAGHGKCFIEDQEGYRDAVYAFLYRYVHI